MDHHQGVELLERSLGWTRVRLAEITEADLTRPTPCSGWDLAALLAHMADSLDAFLEAAHGRVEITVPATADGTAAGARAREELTAKACALLGAWTCGGPGEVQIGRRQLGSGLVAATAALEIAVHGWDVGRSVGSAARLPAPLARALLPVAGVTITPSDRGVRFGSPLTTAPGAPYDVALLGLLGRQGPPMGPTRPRSGTK